MSNFKDAVVTFVGAIVDVFESGEKAIKIVKDYNKKDVADSKPDNTDTPTSEI